MRTKRTSPARFEKNQRVVLTRVKHAGFAGRIATVRRVIRARNVVEVACDGRLYDADPANIDIYRCKTCGSEIVESVNDSAFRDGECGRCEYKRYRSQPELLAACRAMVSGIPDELMDTHLLNLVDRLKAAIKAYGNAA